MLAANTNTNEDSPLNSLFHQHQKIINLLVFSLHIIRYPRSLCLIGSLDFISCSEWHFAKMTAPFQGSTSFQVSIVSPHVTWRNFSLRAAKQILAHCCVATIFCFDHYCKLAHHISHRNTIPDFFIMTFLIVMHPHNKEHEDKSSVSIYIKNLVKFLVLFWFLIGLF